jgi:hypothetical protein
MYDKSAIGRLRESSLHAEVKALYAGLGGSLEFSDGNWVCDARKADGTLVEIQTGNFGPLYRKLSNLNLKIASVLFYR